MDSFTAISIGLLVGAVGLFRGDWSCGKQRMGQHAFVTDHGWPWGIAFQTSKIVFTRLCIEVCDLGHRLFSC